MSVLLICNDKYGALPLVLLAGLVTTIPFAVLVKLGQDYPSEPTCNRHRHYPRPRHQRRRPCSCRCSD
jgi:hypothetical protein